MRIRAAVIACIALTATLLSAPARATPPAAAAPAATPRADKIQPALREQLTRKSVAPVAFWVRFGQQPDLSKAAAIDDWKARGTAVAEALQHAAQSAQHDVRAQLDATGTKYQSFWATNAIRVTSGNLGLAEKLAASTEVEGLYATMSYQLPKLDKKTAQAKEAAAVEWGIANINADDVWDQYGDRGAGITVASIDSGVQYDHPALVNQYRGRKPDGTFDHNYNWFDAQGICGPAPCDEDGHGTHTMGTMLGADGIGVAPDAKWITANGCCPSDEPLIAAGQWMLQPTDLNGQNPDASKRPNIINNSWGTIAPSNDPFMEDITKAWAASGIFAVWSNGNAGFTCDTTSSPASAAGNYSVGAYDESNTVADFSARGTGRDGETKPNLAAPGVNIRSSVPGNGYAIAKGTSMAAPHVSGAVALLWSAAPGLVGDVAATRALLDGSSVDTPDGQCGGTDDDNNVFGEGRLDALALVDHAPVGRLGTADIRVTDSRTHKPVPAAALKVSGPVNRDRAAGKDGRYALALPPGTYTISASGFGYYDQTVRVTVTSDKSTTADVRMKAIPRVTVSGTVKDGSGQGWPLYAKITVDNVPGGVFYTKPEDGRYSFEVPAGATYKSTVEAVYPGYQTLTEKFTLQGRDVRRDVSLTVDPKACAAPGYDFAGVTTDFDHGKPDGWTADNGWHFDDPQPERNQTGGKGGFAFGRAPVSGVKTELKLTSPTLDLRERKEPVVMFRQIFSSIAYEYADVELSLDDGATWQTVLHQQDQVSTVRTVVPIPEAAGRNGVKVRFRYVDAEFTIVDWQLDDVFVGDLTCGPVNGGLVLGYAGDRNTGAVLNGAQVHRAETSVKAEATPADPGVADGFYWMFAPGGRQTIGAGRFDYQDATEQVVVRSGQVNRLDFRLAAGRVSVNPDPVSVDVKRGGVATARVTIKNTGTAPAKVSFRERAGGPGISPTAESSGAGKASGHWPGSPVASPWVDLADYPTRIMDNAVGVHDGQLYSFGGNDGTQNTAKSYVYNPSTRAWSPIADLPVERQNPSGAFIGDTFYLSGGWNSDLERDKSTYGYDPKTNTWTKLADAPVAQAAAAPVVLDGKLYLVGGCTNNCDEKGVFRYDPVSDAWTTLAEYPEPGGNKACVALAGKVYCTGGSRRGGAFTQGTYEYDPATNTWTRKADRPVGVWGSTYGSSYGRMITSGGLTQDGVTTDGYAYDPATDKWTGMESSPTALHAGGSACGLYRIGGSIRSGFYPVNSVQALPTYGACEETDVSWMSLSASGVTVAPGHSVTLTVRLNAAGLKPGVYSAGVWLGEDTPYLAKPVDVSLRVR